MEGVDVISFRVWFQSEGETLRLPRDARLDELSLLLNSAFGALPRTQKLLPRKGKLPPGERESLSPGKVAGDARSGGSTGLLRLGDADVALLTLRQAGIEEGSQFTLLASTDADLTNLAQLRDDPLVRGFEAEEALERSRWSGSVAAFEKPPVAAMDGLGFGGFKELQPSDVGRSSLFPPPSEALRMMYALATDWGIVLVMKKHKWRVGIMTEMPPVGKVGISPRCLLGLNYNRGEKISLRLRTDDLKGFRKYEVVRATLLHELAHMVFDDHDNDFKALNSQLTKEASISGRRLGGAGGDSKLFQLAPANGGLTSSRVLERGHLLVGASGGSRGNVSAAAAIRSQVDKQEEGQQEVQLAPVRRQQEAGHAVAGEQAVLGEPSESVGVAENSSSAMEIDTGSAIPADGGCRDTPLRDPGCHSGTQTSPLQSVPLESPECLGTPEEGSVPHMAATEEVMVASSAQTPTKDSQRPDLAPVSTSSGTAVDEEFILPEDLTGVASGGMDAHSRMRSALEDLEAEARRTGAEEVAKAVATLRVILRNVLEHPDDQRFRTIRKSNRRVRESLGRFPAALALLRVAGFKDFPGQEADEVFWCSAPDPGLLWLACSLLEQSQLFHTIEGRS